MSTHTRWIPAFLVLGLVAFALLGAGCGSGGGGYVPVYAGTLEIENDPRSFEAIVDIEISESFGPYYAYYSDQFVRRNETWFVDLYPTTYDVTLYWSDFFVETYTLDIYDLSTTTIFAFN